MEFNLFCDELPVDIIGYKKNQLGVGFSAGFDHE